jgi:hypothetical protein
MVIFHSYVSLPEGRYTYIEISTNPNAKGPESRVHQKQYLWQTLTQTPCEYRDIA